jgi:thioredoxin reductase
MNEVVIVGGGPARLSAALMLMLRRCRRSVLICDTGKPRNRASRAMHEYLTRDGIPPREFLAIARQELQQYPTVELRDVEVQAARVPAGRPVRGDAGGGEHVMSRKLLGATRVADHVPEIPVSRLCTAEASSTVPTATSTATSGRAATSRSPSVAAAPRKYESMHMAGLSSAAMPRAPCSGSSSRR